MWIQSPSGTSDWYHVLTVQTPGRVAQSVGHLARKSEVLGSILSGTPSRTHCKYSGTRAYCTCSRCGRGVFDIFFSLIYHFSFLSTSLWETARYRLKYCLKGPFNPKQPINQPMDTRSGHILSFLLPLMQEGQLSVTGESMCTKYWLTA